MERIRNIKDLATLAGVSAGTVSRALANSELISAKTRAKVQALAQAHDFRPNALARNLRIQRTGAIGVAIPLGPETVAGYSDPLLIALLGSISDALAARGYDLLLLRVVASDEGWLDRLIGSGRVDGLIVIGEAGQPERLAGIARRYRPLVVWGEGGGRYCSVGSDNRRGGALAAAHLLSRGCRRLAFLGDPRTGEIAARLAGCREAVASDGLAEPLVELPDRCVTAGADPAFARLFAPGGDWPQGIVAASGLLAMSALRALSECGLGVPEDVRVVGFDGRVLGEQTVPPLSSVVQDVPRGAAALVDLLLRRIAGEDTDSLVMEPWLVERQSS